MMMDVLQNLHDVDQYLAELPMKHRDYTERLRYVKSILSELDNPQDKIPVIHIAGTSGKGSTAYYAASLLQHSGYRVGLTVSPHVNYVSERAQVDGSPLPEDQYCQHINRFIDIMTELGHVLSYIEFLDMFAYWLFAELELDYIVMEVGLGGRLDPTNVISRDDKVCVITDIGFDHVEILGDTLAKIAAEKAGIVQDSSIVVMYEQADEVMGSVRRAVSVHDAKLVLASQNTTITTDELPLYQRRNWQLARAAVELRLEHDGKPPLTAEACDRSLLVRIPGRFEIFQIDNTIVILDAAHNPQKLTALTESIRERYPTEPIVYVVAFGHNKAAHIGENLAIIHRTSDMIIATSFRLDDSERGSVAAERIAEVAVTTGFRTVETVGDAIAAVQSAVQLAHDLNAIVVVTGSFYLIDNVRSSFLATSS